MTSENTQKPAYLNGYLISGLFGLAILFAVFRTPLCLVFFVAGIFALAYRIKQVCANFSSDGPVGSYGSQDNQSKPDFNNDMYTLDANSTSVTSGANYSINRELFKDDPLKDVN